MKKKIIISFAVCTTLLLTLAGCGTNSETDLGKKPSNISIEKVDNTVNTYYQASAPYSTGDFGSETAQKDVPALRSSLGVVLAYVEKGYYNPYYISNWWQAKDSFSSKGLKHITPFISPSFSSEMIENEEHSVYAFVPTLGEGESIPEACYASWEAGYCFVKEDLVKPIEIISASVSGDRVTLQVAFTVKTLITNETGSTQEKWYQENLQFELVPNKSITDEVNSPLYVIDSITKTEEITTQESVTF